MRWWITQNEPWIVGPPGHLLGIHGPGERDLGAAARVFHHLLLAHGRAVQELRAGGRGGRAGAAFAPHYAASDVAAGRASDGFVNRWFLDAVLKGSYPDDMRRRYKERLGPLDLIREGDLDLISARSDFVGVNFCFHRVMRAAPGREPFPWEVVPPQAGAPTTDVGTEIVPHAFTDLLLRIHRD